MARNAPVEPGTPLALKIVWGCASWWSSHRGWVLGQG